MTGEPLTLYRGLAVASEDATKVTEQLLENGVRENEANRWHIRWTDLRSELESLYLKPNLGHCDTVRDADEFPIVCACGDLGGAAYYAWKHNKTTEHNAPLVVAFMADVADVFVDGRDFLFTAFQFWDRDKTKPCDAEKQARLLAMLFGEAVLRYFYRAASSEDQEYRIAMCRLASQDTHVVRSHICNTRIIQGRYRTTFFFAFFVRTPITACRIKSITTPPYPTGSPWITLDTFRSGEVS